MATRKKTTAENAVQPPVKGLSDTQRWIYGFALLFFALFVLISVVSFFIHWRDDQNVAEWDRLFSSGEQAAMNWGGKLGAVLSNGIVGGWFGLFALCIPVALIILSLRIMRFRPARLRKSVRLTLILMILGSISLGYLFGDRWGIFGSGLGGEYGIEAARWLVSVLGTVGTGLLLLLSIVLYAIYINRNTISMLNRVGREIVDNGKKMGEAVTSTAAGMIHDSKENSKKTPKDAFPSDRTERRNEMSAKDEEEDDVFEVRTASDMTDDTPFYPGELIDDDGFVVIDHSGRVARKTARPVESENSRTGRSETDEAGFIVTDLNAEEPPRQETDEDGFMIQYARGDAESLPSEIPDGPLSDFPIPSVEGDGTATDSDSRTFATGSASMPDRDLSDGTVSSGEDAFVARVPGDADIVPQENMTVERLPEDETLSAEEIENTLYDPTLDLSSYQRPPVELLEDHSIEVSVSSEEIVENKNRIKETLENFGIKIDKIKATIGPTVTL